MSCFGSCSVQNFWFNWPMGPIVVSTSSSPHHSAKCLFKLSSALSTHSYLYNGTLVCLTTRKVLGFVLMILIGKRSGVGSYILLIICVDRSSVVHPAIDGGAFKITVNYLRSPFELLCLMKLDHWLDCLHMSSLCSLQNFFNHLVGLPEWCEICDMASWW